jgi:hypothetical protein
MSMGAMRFMRALSSVVVLAAAAASAFATPPAQNSNLNSAIIPPTAHYAGLTYGEWLAGLNEWIL